MKGKPATSKDPVKPFKHVEEEEEQTPGVAWIGPYHVGCCIVEIFGPLQIVFAVLAFLALVFLIIELVRGEGFDWLRFIVGVVFILVCLYLVWLSKSIYVLRSLRREVDRFSLLNKDLKGRLSELTTQNEEHSAINLEQERLNAALSDKVKDLSGVERMLGVFSQECKGNVLQARQSLERLERNVKLDTVNCAVLFFDRADRDCDGKVSSSEVPSFVEGLSFLGGHLPQFDRERMRATILQQGGLTRNQVHTLVDVMMLQLESGDPADLAQKLETTLLIPKNDASDDELDGSAVTICPPKTPNVS